MIGSNVMSKSKKTDNRNYRIFRVEKTKWRIFPKKITMMRIYAKDDDDACLQLKDYIKAANKQYAYYVEPWTPNIEIIDGKRYECDDFIEAMELHDKLKPWYKKAYDAVSLELWHWFVSKPKNAYCWCRDLVYLVKNKQEYSTAWCIDDRLLDLIKFNLPILKKHKHTLSWAMLEKAYLEKHPELSVADAKKHFETNCDGYGKDVQDRSVELEHKMFDDLIDDINAYNYYMHGYDYVDPNDKEQVEIDKKLRHTLPLIKGSYDRYDYKKLNTMIDKHWNKIWETVRKYGREMND